MPLTGTREAQKTAPVLNETDAGVDNSEPGVRNGEDSAAPRLLRGIEHPARELEQRGQVDVGEAGHGGEDIEDHRREVPPDQVYIIAIPVSCKSIPFALCVLKNLLYWSSSLGSRIIFATGMLQHYTFV